MSYERMCEELQTASCACGKGRVVRKYYREMNDWNQINEGYFDEEIQCEFCKDNFHIEQVSRSCFCPSWEGDGIVREVYLVLNGETLSPICKYTRRFGGDFEATCVAEYDVAMLEKVIDDMQRNKYSTRIEKKESKDIVYIYKRYYKKQALPAIVSMLKECVANYNSYEWTYDKVKKYREKQRKEQEDNEKYIAEVKKKSFLLDFK